MKRKMTFSLLLILLATLTSTSPVAAQENQPVSPEKYFGFTPGSDGNLFDYDHLISYLQELTKVSDRIKLEQIGLVREKNKS